MIVLDTSVVVKWFVLEESGCERARAIRGLHFRGDIEIIVPSLTLYELCSALGRREWVPDEVDEALRLLERAGIVVVRPSRRVLVRAAELCRRRATSFYDELFVALAELAGAHLITADEEHYAKARDSAQVHLLTDLDISDVPRWHREAGVQDRA